MNVKETACRIFENHCKQYEKEGVELTEALKDKLFDEAIQAAMMQDYTTRGDKN